MLIRSALERWAPLRTAWAYLRPVKSCTPGRSSATQLDGETISSRCDLLRSSHTDRCEAHATAVRGREHRPEIAVVLEV
jgi:hypothetical protein